MTVLVHVEVHGDEPDADGLGILTAARAAGLDPVAVVVGSGLDAAVAVVGRHGPTRVFVLDHPSLAAPDVAPRAAAVGAVIDRYDAGLWLAPTTTVTTEVAAVLSARLDAGIHWGLVGLGHERTATRLAGNDTIVAEVTWATTWGIGLFRPHACDPAIVDEMQAEADVEHVAVPPVADGGVSIVELMSEAGTGTALAAADTIVAAGRGIGSRDHLELVRELARLLGGVPAVSLPLVELGWAPRSMQVGQTGATVAPLLYIACGISGQIQHRVGMERSGTIIAINTDAGAPIMGWCDLAVVASAPEVLRSVVDMLTAGSEATAG